MKQNMSVRLPQFDKQALEEMAAIRAEVGVKGLSVSELLREVIHDCIQKPEVSIPNAIQRRMLNPNVQDLPSDKETSFYIDQHEADAFKAAAKKAGYKVEGLLKLMVEDRILH